MNFRDPWGLCEDGDEFIKRYTDRLMRNPFSSGNIWDTMTVMDIKGNPESYECGGSNYRSDEMGNIAPGYATTVAWGPIASAGAMFGAEIIYMDFSSTTIRQDAIGICDAILDNPKRTLLSVIFPCAAPSISVVNWVLYE